VYQIFVFYFFYIDADILELYFIYTKNDFFFCLFCNADIWYRL